MHRQKWFRANHWMLFYTHDVSTQQSIATNGVGFEYIKSTLRTKNRSCISSSTNRWLYFGMCLLHSRMRNKGRTASQYNMPTWKPDCDGDAECSLFHNKNIYEFHNNHLTGDAQSINIWLWQWLLTPPVNICTGIQLNIISRNFRLKRHQRTVTVHLFFNKIVRNLLFCWFTFPKTTNE